MSEKLNALIKQISQTPRKALIVILVSFILGVLISSLFWQSKVKDSKSALDYKDFEIKNLTDQISALREDQRNVLNPTPSPTPIPFVKKESLDSQNTYILNCYDSSKDKTAPTWLTSVEGKLGSDSKVVNGCFNETLNKVVFISTKTVDKGGFGRPGVNEFKFAIFNVPDSSIQELSTSQGSYLGGYCGTITNWSKSANIYYQCGGGDGPWGTTQTYQLNIQTKAKGITDSCYTFEDRTTCTNYCKSSADCKSGSFCNLEQNSCVQSCTTDKDCVNSACKPLGGTMACVQ